MIPGGANYRKVASLKSSCTVSFTDSINLKYSLSAALWRVVPNVGETEATCWDCSHAWIWRDSQSGGGLWLRERDAQAFVKQWEWTWVLKQLYLEVLSSNFVFLFYKTTISMTE